MSEPFLGEIRMFGGNFAPVGWRLCDGSLLPIGDNEALFQLIGTTYGGDGENNFALPDLRGRAPMHYGQGSGLSSYQLAESTGTEAVTLTVNQVREHVHRLQGDNSAGNSRDPSGRLPARPSPTGGIYKSSPGSLTPMATDIVGPQTSSALPHNNRQPYVAVSFIIAIGGIYPPPAD